MWRNVFCSYQSREERQPWEWWGSRRGELSAGTATARDLSNPACQMCTISTGMENLFLSHEQRDYFFSRANWKAFRRKSILLQKLIRINCTNVNWIWEKGGALLIAVSSKLLPNSSDHCFATNSPSFTPQIWAGYPAHTNATRSWAALETAAMLPAPAVFNQPHI